MSLAYTATQSGLGIQTRSTRTSAENFTIAKAEVHRMPGGLPKFATKEDKKYQSEAFQRHYIPDTPGPGKYGHRVSMGNQALSRNRAPIAHSFSTTPRFAYVDRMIKKNATPGPGEYVN